MLCPADYLSLPGKALSLKKVVCCHKQSCFLFQQRIKRMQRIRLSESMNAGVHRIKRIWQSHATCSCRQICYIRRTLAFIVLFSLFVTFVRFVVQQYCPSMKDFPLPGKACHQLLRSLPLPSSSNAWAMGFNLHAFTRQTLCL